MLRFQARLERLPVPRLEETCELYLRLVAPLLAAAELARTRRAVDEFRQPGGRGEVLQQRLLRRSEDTAQDNWLEPFWDDWYLCDDTPLVVNVSPGFVLSGSERPQVDRAAGLLSAALRFKALVDGELLEPDLEGGAARCMSEYPRVLGSTRIPGATRDRLERHPESRHVVVVRKHRLYSLDVLDESGRAYAVEDLERALRRIVAGPENPGLPVGVLTTGRRRTWARVREEHLESGSPAARASLAAVETAILLLVLEHEAAPPRARSSEAARLMLHGDARGRWFDKSIQLVVAANGVAGFCMEHAGFDGSTAQRLADFLVEHEIVPPDGAASRRRDLVAAELALEPTRELAARTGQAERRADALVGRTDLAVLAFEDFGKDEIAGLGLSPDGFVQMALQLAFFSLTGTVASTYESVDTKRFLHGRTEAMRSVSPESVAFVRALGGSPRRRAAAARLLRAAVASHTATVRRCKEGRGVDRHLLGLRRMLEPGEPVPPLFADSGYTTLTRSVLSTSSLRGSGSELVCFGPVVDEGFGLSYAVHDGSLRVVITSFHGLARDFAELLERGLLEMRSVLTDS
jgi:carnitine O-acetyltransferase